MRRRMISPEFFTDPDMVANFDFAGRLFYQGLWCVAEDSGCFEMNALALKMKIFPGDDLPLEQIQEYLDKLVELGKIIVYQVEGRQYGWIKNFLKHQKLDKPAPPSIPLPDFIVWHGEEEFGDKRHKYHYEVVTKAIPCSDHVGDLSGTCRGHVGDVSTTEERQVVDSSTPEEKRREKKRREYNISSSSNDEEQPSAVVGPPPNGKEIIAKLVAQYREVVPEDKHTKHDYSFVGRLHKEYGHDAVLSAINELGYRIEGGKPPDEPLIYLRGILKNQADKPDTRASPEEPPEDPIKAAIEHNRRVLEEIDRQRRKRLEQMEQRIAAWAKSKKK